MGRPRQGKPADQDQQWNLMRRVVEVFCDGGIGKGVIDDALTARSLDFVGAQR